MSILAWGALVAACAPTPPSFEPAHAYSTEAGVLYVAGPRPGSVRVLYARGGSMALIHDVMVVPGTKIGGLQLDPDRGVLWVYAGDSALALDAAALRSARTSIHAALIAESRLK